MIWFAALALLSASASADEPADDDALRVGDTNFHFVTSVEALAAGSSTFGGQAGLSIQAAPFAGHGLMAGPRVTVLAAGGSDGTRLDLGGGGEATLWFVNAIGPGGGFDVFAPSITGSNGIDSRVHYRGESFLNIRFRHLRQTGAWAVRGSLFYDTQFKLGAGVGITLQFSGVPAAGNPDAL